MTTGPKLPLVAIVTAAAVPPDALQPATDTLREFGIETLEVAPQDVAALVLAGKIQGWRAVIVASEDAEMPGSIARAVSVPVVRVPVDGGEKRGLALLVAEGGNLPAPAADGAPFATVAIGPAGAKNAALFVVSVLALDDDRLCAAWDNFRAAQTEAVLRQPPPG